MSTNQALTRIKLLHTAVWFLLVVCILAIPAAGMLERFRLATVLSAIIVVEVFVLIAYGWKCPLTILAERYTDDRADNFDIYLPLWLARYNKLIFGSVFAIGEVYVLVRWWINRVV